MSDEWREGLHSAALPGLYVQLWNEHLQKIVEQRMCIGAVLTWVYRKYGANQIKSNPPHLPPRLPFFSRYKAACPLLRRSKCITSPVLEIVEFILEIV